MIINSTYGHGGDVYKNEIEQDFSINVNPFGTPEEVVQAAAEACSRLTAYPDPYCLKLRDRLSAVTGRRPEEIICGNGAAELVFQFVQALKPTHALLPVPSFSEYESALAAAGCPVDYYFLKREEGFALTRDILAKITKETQLLMLCSPNNPTGLCIGRDLLMEILQKCRETGTWLFLDECFLDLSDEEKAFSLIPYLEKNDRVFILRAFTKMFGMAGVRLGYGLCADAEMLEKMCVLVQPWNISAVAQAAGLAALSLTGWQEKTRQVIRQEKAYLMRELKALGINVLPGEANFLMLSGVGDLYERLLERKILIRNCANYKGLEKGDVRIAVRLHEENEAFIAVLKEMYHA